MSEVTASIKIIGEVAIGLITALVTGWVTLKQMRKEIPPVASDSISATLKEMTAERNELIELLRQTQRENLRLQKELARLGG